MENNVRKLNIWETKFKDDFIYINSYEELIKFMEENDIFTFELRDDFVPGDSKKCIYDEFADRANIHLTYTDDMYPVVVINRGWLKKILINPYFFERYKEQFKNFMKVNIIKKLKEVPFMISIPDFVVDDEVVNSIISNDELGNTDIKIIECLGQSLPQEQLQKLSQSKLEISLMGNKISTKYAIGYSTWKDIETSSKLSFKDDLSDHDIANFVYLNDETVVTIMPTNRIDEPKYVANLLRICKVLQSHNRKYNIKIEINNRELLMESGILDFSNIDWIINNDGYDYKKNELLEEDRKLEQLIKPIREANLSSYEKYLAVYNIVKQFKPYKENNEKKEEARYLRYIIDDNNEYMVCVGYAKLLTALLNKIGISSYNISVSVDISYDSGFTMEDKVTDIAGHQRNIVKLDDDKYDIHGIFVADATWDNDMERDLYNNSAMTFDRKKEAFRLETLKDEDLLLDFHDFNEFSSKINFYLKRKIKKSFSSSDGRKIVDGFKNMYDAILKILSCLDYRKYSELYGKYNNLIVKYISDYKLGKISLKEVEAIFNQFLGEYANYIIPLSNRAISDDILLEALTNVKRELGNYSEEELNDMVSDVYELNKKMASGDFPYRYDPNNPIPNYLESRSDEESSLGHSR